MFGDRTITGRNAVIGLGLALVAATAAFGALLGATLPARTGLEEITVLGVAVPVSPLTLAVYGAVAVGALLIPFGLVVGILSRFDDDAM
ncbi:DUF7520 family protein [Natrinema salaciae]|uniref:Cox cluster protein n=1 Tax=Natrinema salaciae TaxID=1186196 RepID=A0A1H9H1L4_9EURY|nr:hypothetical protein [Natrinema salaciae]SEQ56127.1 hypothetical protein SAMN04489841_2061 [Natrinema salaciae]